MKRNNDNPHENHEIISTLLPWYVNQTLQGTELATVEQHLKACPLCKSEIVSLQQLSVTIRHVSTFNTSPQPSFARLKERLQAASTTPQSQQAPMATVIRPNKWANLFNVTPSTLTNPGLALAAAGMLLAVVLFRVIDVNHMLNNDYQTLSDTKTVASNPNEIRVIFKDNTSQQAIEQILAAIEGNIVSGPDVKSLYTIGLKKTSGTSKITDKLLQLRSNADVVFAEPGSGILSKAQPKKVTP